MQKLYGYFVIVAAVTSSFCGVAGSKETKRAEQIEQRPAASTKVETVSWGDLELPGLQMGAWQSEANAALVLCSIRNQGKNDVLYNLCYLGTGEGISVFARPQGTKKWQLISMKKDVLSPLEGIGSSAYKVVALAPGQQIPDYVGQDRYKFEPSVSSSLPFVLFPTDSKLSDAEKKAVVEAWRLSHTFAVQLWEYEWPKTWSGTIELRVGQRLTSDEARPSWQGTLKSGALKLPVAVLRTNPFERELDHFSNYTRVK